MNEPLNHLNHYSDDWIRPVINIRSGMTLLMLLSMPNFNIHPNVICATGWIKIFGSENGSKTTLKYNCRFDNQLYI